MPHPGDHSFSGPVLQRNHSGSRHSATPHRDGMDCNCLGHRSLHFLISWGKGKKCSDRPTKFQLVFRLLLISTSPRTSEFLFVGICAAQGLDFLSGLDNCRTRRPNTLGNDPPPHLRLHAPEYTGSGDLTGEPGISGREECPPNRWVSLSPLSPMTVSPGPGRTILFSGAITLSIGTPLLQSLLRKVPTVIHSHRIDFLA